MIRYISPDADASGNGTTKTLTGANCPYLSLSIAEAAEDLNPLSASETLTWSCFGDAQDTTALVLTGTYTTSATYKIIIQGDPDESNGAHDGKWDDAKFTLSVVDNNAAGIREDHVDLLNFQVEVGNTNTTSRRGIRQEVVGAGSRLLCSGMLVREKPGNSGTGSLVGFDCNDADGKIVFVNGFVYDFQAGAARGYTAIAGTAVIYNSGFHNNEIGVRQATGITTVVKNTWGQSNATDFSLASGSWGTGTGYNLSEDTSAPGGNSQVSTAMTFVLEGSDDFHISSGSNGEGDGTDLSSDPEGHYSFSTDIDGDSRPDWSIGPDEVAAVAGGHPTRRRFGGISGMSLSLGVEGVQVY